MSDPVNIFMEASRKQLRFATATGHVAVEDLWGLPLAKLDAVAVEIDARLSSAGKTFLVDAAAPKSAAREEDTLRLEIIKEVIRVRQEEKAAKKRAAENAGRLAILTEALEKKRLGEIEALSADALQAQIDELKAQGS